MLNVQILRSAKAHTGRPKPPMVIVGKCVLVRRSASGWWHLGISRKKAATKMCSHPEHWDFDIRTEDHPEVYGMKTVVVGAHRPSTEAKRFAEKIGAELDQVVAFVAAMPSPRLS